MFIENFEELPTNVKLAHGGIRTITRISYDFNAQSQNVYLHNTLNNKQPNSFRRELHITYPGVAKYSLSFLMNYSKFSAMEMHKLIGWTHASFYNKVDNYTTSYRYLKNDNNIDFKDSNSFLQTHYKIVDLDKFISKKGYKIVRIKCQKSNSKSNLYTTFVITESRLSKLLKLPSDKIFSFLIGKFILPIFYQKGDYLVYEGLGKVEKAPEFDDGFQYINIDNDYSISSLNLFFEPENI